MTDSAFKDIVDIIMKVHEDFMKKFSEDIENVSSFEAGIVISGRSHGATDIVKAIIAALKKAAEEGKI